MARPMLPAPITSTRLSASDEVIRWSHRPSRCDANIVAKSRWAAIISPTASSEVAAS